MAAESLIHQTQRMLQAVTGSGGRESTAWEEVAAALSQGVSDIVVEVPWQHPGEAPARHEIVLKHRDGERLVFYNPKAHGDLAVGAVLPPTGALPERRVEGTGLESLPEFVVRDLFMRGEGVALIP